MATRNQERTAAIREAVALLGVRRGATLDEVIQARRLQAKLWHPDVNPGTGSAERMRAINSACDLLCDVIRRGGTIEGPARPKPPLERHRSVVRQPAVFEVDVDQLRGNGNGSAVGLPIGTPDRHARVEIDRLDALEGGTRVVRFVRSEPGRCMACAGLGASPAGPKRVCPDCRGESVSCVTCDGRGWLHRDPGSCRRCAGTGAGLVEQTIRLKLPPGIDELRRVLIKGWGDLQDDGTAGNLWIDLVPVATSGRSAPWHFDHFGHNWPRPQGRHQGEWLAILNAPLPDEEMRDLGFWRDPESGEWIRQAPGEAVDGIMDLIVQRQFFVPQVGR
jgi:hypothetical protein